MKEKNLNIVPVCEGDIREIAAIEERSFSTPWSDHSFEEALQREENIFLCAKDGEKVVGYLLLYTMLEEGEIPTIAVTEECRRAGIGRDLLKAAFAECRVRGVQDIYLEVRKSNTPALSLYQKVGFAVVGVRKDFYTDPTEDAYLCKIHIEDRRLC